MIIPHLFSLASHKAIEFEFSSISLNQNKVLEAISHFFVPALFGKTDEYVVYILTASRVLRRGEDVCECFACGEMLADILPSSAAAGGKSICRSD